MCRQWRFQHSGSTRAFDSALYCRTRACMLCMFVLPPTSLIKVVNSGYFHWALSVFIYFRFMLAFRVQFAGDVKKRNIVRNNGSLEYVRSRFTRAHPLEPELPSAIKYFFNLINIRLNVFLKQWVCIEHWI